MPYTKRMPHYGSPKQLLSYILDDKNYGLKVAETSSLNCNVETSLLEFKDNQNRFEMRGNRVAYHIIQSFSPLDKISPSQANEIGKRLCEELYPDFQCVISTHIDKGHIHNHICLNAINIKGNKLEDRLANAKEGLYGLSDTSDKIAAEYGCYIMPKRKFSKIKNKDYYYQYKEQTWKEKIEADLEEIIPRCNTVEELLDELSILGYEIKRGKHISVKVLGMQKFARLSTINEKYTIENLCKFYKEIINIKLSGIKVDKNSFNSFLYDKATESKKAIEKSQLSAGGKVYSEYQKTKYKEIKRYYELKKQLEYLDKYNIRSFDDIEREINIKRNEIKSINIEFKKMKKDIDEVIDKTTKAQDYIKLYDVYRYAMSYKEIDPEYNLPKEARIFLKLQQELGISNIDEAKHIISELRTDRININKMQKQILDLQRELNHLDTIKEEQLNKSNLFIHNIKFGGNHIDYKKSDDNRFCITLPYTKDKIYIDKKFTAYNEKYQYYTLYLVDDKKYDLYDENDNKINSITGIGLESYVMDMKKEIDSLYS